MRFQLRILRSFFVVILCLGGTLTVYDYLTVTRRIERRSIEHLAMQVNRVQKGIDRFWEQRQHEMLLMALSPVLGAARFDAPVVSGRLQQFRDTLKVFDRLTLVERDGRVMADTLSGRVGTAVSSEPFRQALAGRSGYLFSLVPGHRQATMTFYAPLFDQGRRVHRVLLATVQFDQIHQLIDDYSEDLMAGIGLGSIELLAPDGRRLYASREQDPVFAVPADWHELSRQLPDRMTRGASRVLHRRDRLDLLAATGPSGPQAAPWILHISVPSASLFREPRQHLLLSLGFTALLLLVAWAWMRSIAASLSRPVELLADAAEFAGQGDFSVAAHLAERQDEFRPLFDKFKEMAQRLAEQTRALQAANSEWQNTFDTVQDPVCIIDNELHITRCNRAMLELLGRNEREVLGKSCHQLLHAGQRQVEQCPHSLSMQDHKPHQLELYEPLFERWLKITTAPLFDPHGGLAGSVHVLHDVTTDHLAADSLRQAAQDAKSASEAKSRFLAVMSHEIRTPLNGINGMVQLLRDSDLTQNQVEFLDCIEISAENLLSVINDILDFSKIEAGRLDLELTPFSLGAVRDDLLREQRLRAQAKGLQLSVALTPGSIDLVTGDPFRLRQVLNNLVSNAIKFTASGEVAVTLDALSVDGGVLLTGQVRDSGIGISPEAQRTIFDPFVQADSSTTRTFGGTGLGLTICKQLVELMGGTIRVASTPGQGTVFTFTVLLGLGAPDLSASAALDDNHPPQPADRPLKVLVAEDQAINRRFIVEILKRHNCSVLSAVNGCEAVSLWVETPLDLVLMDVQMPEMDGMEALKAIRGHEEGTGRHTPVIAITAHAIHGDKERLLAAGFDGYVSKPVQVSGLLSEMDRIMAQSGA